MADNTSFTASSPSYSGSVSHRETDTAELGRAAANQQLPAALCEELHTSVARAAGRSTESMNDLQRAVANFTAQLRVGGATPEAVLIALKSVINSRNFPVARSCESETSDEDLRQRISAWSIQEFFREAKA